MLVEEGLIDIKLVDKLLHNNILGNWDTLEPFIREMQRRLDANVGSYQMRFYPHYDAWERLVHSIKQISTSNITA